MSAADDRIVEAMGVPYAREGLARLREAGFDVVPREPSDAMLDAGGKSGPFVAPGNGKIVAATVWRAMVEAARADQIVGVLRSEPVSKAYPVHVRFLKPSGVELAVYLEEMPRLGFALRAAEGNDPQALVREVVAAVAAQLV